jgi:hypothetical protein
MTGRPFLAAAGAAAMAVLSGCASSLPASRMTDALRRSSARFAAILFDLV